MENAFPPDSKLVTRVCPSPNHDQRAGTAVPDMIVLHYTGVHPDAEEEWLANPGQAALLWLCNPVSKVSSHYLVELDGTLIQLVPESRRARHAGVSSWEGETDLNSASIGIEIANVGHDHGLPPFPEAQIATVTLLCKELLQRYKIPAQRVVGHSDIAPERKDDPGERFPWDELYREGIGTWLAPAPLDTPGETLQAGSSGSGVAAVRQALAKFGYGLPASEQYDLLCEQTVRAFQRHFRPALVDGKADPSTVATLRRLNLAVVSDVPLT